MALFGLKKNKEEGKAPVKDAEVEAVQKDEVKKPVKATSGANDIKISPEAMAYGVIIAPIVTEKSHVQNKAGKYVFRVAKTANKTQISKIISSLYNVTVTSVNIVNIPKKRRTVKYDRGYQSAYKKAIVTVKKGQHITAFDLA